MSTTLMAFDGIETVQQAGITDGSAAVTAPVRPQSRSGAVVPSAGKVQPGRPRRTLPMDRLPFVGVRGDGQQSYWMMPALEETESAALRARTYAAWFLVYAELNGPEKAQWLMDRIEREMPSRYPATDRIFLDEVLRRR